MNKLRNILFLLILVQSARLFSNNQGVMVRPAGDELIETEPKSTVTTTIRVTNLTSSEQEFISKADLPKGWKLITKDFPFRMAAEASEIKLLSFYIPQMAASGQYEITYHVMSRQYPSLSDHYTLAVVVLPFRKLGLSILQAPENIIGGEAYQVLYMITNESNVADSVTFEVRSGNGFKAKVTPTGLKMMPGRSDYVSVHVVTQEKISKSFLHRLKLSARFSFKDDYDADVSSAVLVIPKEPVNVDPYHRLPMNVKLRHVVKKDKKGATKSGSQIDISGEGTLDQEGERKVAYRLRAPDVYDTSILTERDEIFMKYQDKKHMLHLGDRYYSLSPLTEFSRYGRGVEIGYTFNKYQAGAYYQKTRWMSPKQSQFAAYFRYPWKEGYDFRLNFLRKWGERIDGNILSASINVIPYKNATLEAELAAGETKSKMDNAYRIKLNGKTERLYYYFSLIHAGKYFPGYYSDRDLISGAFSVSLTKNLRFDINARQYEDRYELKEYYVSVLNKYYYMMLRYKLGRRGPSIRVGVGGQGREDLQPTPRFNYYERTARLELSQYFKIFSISFRADYGLTDNKLLGENLDLQRYALSMRFKPSKRQTYRGYLYYDNNRRYGSVENRSFTYGINADLLITQKTKFELNYQNNNSWDEFYTDRNVFDIRFKHTLPNNHQVSVQARKTILRNTIDNEDMAVLLEYHVPIGIKMERKKNVGLVKGHVCDSETQEPIKDVIIRINGAVAITNKEGDFLFPILEPKTYYLSVDKANLGLNRVTERKSPLEVVVKGGHETYIDLAITHSAALHGQVMVYKIVNDSTDHFSENKMKYHMDEYYVAGNGNGNGHKDGNGKKNGTGVVNGKTKLVEDYGLPNTLIEMKKDDGEIQRRITDHNGRFQFEDLRPGKWIVKVYDDYLPQDHVFKKDTFEVLLQPQDKKDIKFMVVPRKRRIRFMQEGGTIKEQPESQKEIKIKKKNQPKPKKDEIQKDENFQAQYDMGLKKFNEKKYSEAIRILKELLASNKNYRLAGNCQYWIGESYRAQMDNRQALRAFNAVKNYLSSYKADDALLKSGIPWLEAWGLSQSQG